MGLFLIPLFAVCLIGTRFSGKDFRQDYMSPASTTAINGIFTVLVLMHHIVGSNAYRGGGFTDDILLKYLALGQLIVVTFLFFSGYGIAESLKNKPGYALKMPKNRIFKTWLNLALALIPYIIMNLLTHEKMTVRQVLFSLIGWDSVGNSNWFMFVILALYLAVFLAFVICKNKFIPGTILTTILTLGLTAALILAKKESHWWNTAVFYPLGMWFSVLKPTAEKIFQKSNIGYWLSLIASTFLFAGTHLVYCKTQKNIIFMASAAFMTATIILVLMKFTINNKFLQWLGKNLFGIYILQRLPMRLIEHFDIGINKYLYTLLIAAITFVLAFAFGKLTDFINKKLFTPNNPNLKKG